MSIAPTPLFLGKGLKLLFCSQGVCPVPREEFLDEQTEDLGCRGRGSGPSCGNAGRGEEGGEGSADQPTVSVPVSASDTLTMFFQAEGIMSDSADGIVTKALEGAEGIAGLKVRIIEGIGSVELTKQTTIEATGVASGLVETMQGAGFKLQMLNLSFDDQEEVLL